MGLLETRQDGTRIYGPYVYPGTKRRLVTLSKPDGTHTSTTYARYLYELAHGEIDGQLCVDHLDEDCSNDTLNNYQLLSRRDNALKSNSLRVMPEEWYEFTCPVCGCTSRKLARKVRHNRKQGKAGPFCGKSCAGKWSTR